MTARPRARLEDVLAALRADVLGGVYAPGERLKFASLGERYGASVSVLREALTRLVDQSLVESEPRIGFRVVDLTPEGVADLARTRIDVEGLALRRAVERGGVDWEAELVGAHHLLERTPVFADGDPPRVSDEWERAHARFHACLVEGCGSPRLTGIATALQDAAELHRRLSGPREPGRDVAAEHRRILQAALARDADAAAAALADHIQTTADILLGRLSTASP